jgi:alcohol dehydrogenase
MKTDTIKKILKTGELALFNGPGKPFKLQHSIVPDLKPGEVLVKNVYTTICGSDLHTYCGLRNEPCPTILGHEIVGQVESLHPLHTGFDLRGKSIKPGDLITWTVFSSNPQSVNSLLGIPQKGDNLFKYGHSQVTADNSFHGGLSEYCILKPNTGIIKLPNDLPVEIASTLNCSIATVAGALRMAGEIRGKNILITGMGHLGITCAAMCREAGAQWIGAADIASERLENALQFGATEIFSMKDQQSELKLKLSDKTKGKGIDVVFDMSGSPDAMEFGLDILAIGGCAIWIGAVFNTRTINVNPEHIIRRLITIKGLHNYNFQDFINGFDFLEQNWKKYPFGSVVEKEFTLSQADEAFEYAVANRPLRVGIRL